MPHTVLQLSCIVNSLTVSRGWSQNALKGHVLGPPALARPRRDVDVFLDRENESMCHGYCQGSDILGQFLERDSVLHGNPKRHALQIEKLNEVRKDFVNWWGETKYISGLTKIEPSRFSNKNLNNLSEYSPVSPYIFSTVSSLQYTIRNSNISIKSPGRWLSICRAIHTEGYC